MQGSKSEMHRIVILVAIPVEFQAVRVHLRDLREEKHKDTKTMYVRGRFTARKRVWDVILGQTGAGNVRAAVEAERAINYYKPRVVFFIGIAGRLKDAELGDVVVASKVYSYESGKAGDVYHVRPDVGIPKYSFIQLAEAEARKADWLKRLGKNPPPHSPRVLIAPIVAGENVLASTHSQLYQFLRENYDHAVGVEMEGHGFYQACYAHPEVDALCIRGISDLIDHKKETDMQNWQDIAARNASAFAFALLAKLDDAYFRAPESGLQSSIAEKDATSPRSPGSSTTENAFHNEMQAFHQAAEKQIAQVKEITAFFGDGHTTFSDQRKRALNVMNDLKAFLKQWTDLILRVRRSVNWKISDLRVQVDELRSELDNFPSAPSFGRHSQYYIETQKRVQEKLGRLLDSLEQLEKSE
ncbi:MAG: 5'-methylthioadenosine/S-adenosylhomocysteine nucleosidase [Ktedonobacteraceae bacterium]|nr:5'-methylthioadenosine/S-adenosylhomocysteine nucleosidase [Ktedonobacteraceae bacterium]